jgi:N-acyl-D-aspartate/D-glutamate deacylase
MTRIESFLFDAWTDKPEEEYRKLQWVPTGERLTRETFLKYRKQGGYVLIHANTEERVRIAIAHPLTMIASDGFDIDPPAHPRSVATYSRVLGRYVREAGALTLMQALRKMTLMPAQRWKRIMPEMRDKGRDGRSDIVIFDPARSTTWRRNGRRSILRNALRLVNGAFVVRDGKVVEAPLPAAGAPPVPGRRCTSVLVAS